MISPTTRLLGGLSLVTLLATGCIVTTENSNGSGGNAPTSSDPSSSSSTNGSGGSGGAGGEGTGGAGGEGTGGGGSGGSGGGDYIEQPGQPDNNDDRDNAVEISPNGKFTLFITEDDQDWLKFTTPDDGKAHLITLEYTQPTDGGFRLDVLADADYSKIDTIWTDAGVKKTVFFTVGPNATTLLNFELYRGAGGTFNYTISDTPENDTYEPNNDRPSAKEVALNTDIQGQLWLPYVSEADQVADDWFKAELATGEVTLKLTHTPANQRYQIAVFDSTGTKIDSFWGTGLGATGEEKITIESAGTHYFQLHDYGSAHLDGIIEETKPKSLSEQYTFRIEQ